MDRTANYNLPKWEMTDRVLMDDFNDMTEKLDEALASKAQVAFGTYVGTGETAATFVRTLSFDFTPKLVMVCMNDGDVYHRMTVIRGMTTCRIYSMFGNSDYTATVNLTWGEKSLSWSPSKDAKNSLLALNYSGTTYCYFAIG